MRHRALAISLLPLLLLPALLRAEDDPAEEAEVRRLLATARKDDEPGWRNAVRELRRRGGEPEASLDRILSSLLKTRRSERDTTAQRLLDLVRHAGPEHDPEKRRLAWEKARERAREWIFSMRSFPDVPDPIKGPEEGYDEAIAREKAAAHAFAALRSALERAVSPALRLSPKEARRLREDRGAAVARLERIRAEMREPPPDETPSIPPLVGYLLDCAEGRFVAAARLYRDMPDGWTRLVGFYAYGRAVLERNRRDSAGHAKSSVKAIAGLNADRMAIGISPLVHNEKLRRMAEAHSEEMRTRGYMSHESPVAENRTTRHRARNVGYPVSVLECISGRASARDAIATWKWDGGHHRILFRYDEVGLAPKGPTVLNVGAGEKGAPPAIRY
jgi:hypothetical protein